MFAVAHQFQVRWAVVTAALVVMVNMLIARQIPTEHGLHHEAVFLYVAALVSIGVLGTVQPYIPTLHLATNRLHMAAARWWTVTTKEAQGLAFHRPSLGIGHSCQFCRLTAAAFTQVLHVPSFAAMSVAVGRYASQFEQLETAGKVQKWV